MVKTYNFFLFFGFFSGFLLSYFFAPAPFGERMPFATWLSSVFANSSLFIPAIILMVMGGALGLAVDYLIEKITAQTSHNENQNDPKK